MFCSSNGQTRAKFSFQANRKQLIEIKKRRRKETILKNSTPPEIQITAYVSRNSSLSNKPTIHHRPQCAYYQRADGHSAPISLCPSFADAPAASPELSQIVDSVNTAIELQIMPHSQSFVSEPENGSIPFNRASVQLTEKSASSDLGRLENNVEHRPCNCYQKYDISDASDVHDDENDDDGDVDDEEDEKKKKSPSKLCQIWHRFVWAPFLAVQRYTANFVASKYFRRIVLTAIVINTLSMGIEYHGQPQSLTNALEYSNLVFTSLFAVEMVLKIIAEGCLKYIKNAYNLFDGGIVVMSIIELQGQKNSGLSVLRTFRLLRVLKLVRFMPTLRRQLVSNAVDNLNTCVPFARSSCFEPWTTWLRSSPSCSCSSSSSGEC